MKPKRKKISHFTKRQALIKIAEAKKIKVGHGIQKGSWYTAMSVVDWDAYQSVKETVISLEMIKDRVYTVVMRD